MEFKNFKERGGGYFKADDDGIEAGRLDYNDAGTDKLIINHTEVNPKYSGHGIGTQMVMACVDYARENNLKIVPICPFARNVFIKNTQIHDVLYK